MTKCSTLGRSNGDFILWNISSEQLICMLVTDMDNHYYGLSLMNFTYGPLVRDSKPKTKI